LYSASIYHFKSIVDAMGQCYCMENITESEIECGQCFIHSINEYKHRLIIFVNQ